MAAESGTAPDEETNGLAAPRDGWQRLEGVGEPAEIFVLDPQRPDYPEKWRSREEARERAALASDPGAQAAIAELRAEWHRLDFDRVIEAVVRGSEIREHTGDAQISRLSGALLDRFYHKVRAAAERVAPTVGTTYPTTIRYIAEQTLPVDLVLYVVDETLEPIKIVVNADRRKKLLLSLSPGETMLRFRGIVRRDLNRIGRFVTEALEIADPEQRRNRGGRPAITDEGRPATTPELLARLSHWEGWSHRRIAAFVGWLGPDDDWSDPHVRTRTEQRVRRWIRLGEGGLRLADTDNTDDDNAWRRRPDHLERAVRAEAKRAGRR